MLNFSEVCRRRKAVFDLQNQYQEDQVAVSVLKNKIKLFSRTELWLS